jgi:hypothetical protein
MIQKYFILVSVLIFFAQVNYAQVIDRDALEDIIEGIAESSEEELDYTALFEDLFYFSQHPLNLNIANREDLEKFQFLNDFQIEGILEYKRMAGEMKTIYEMQLIKDFSFEDIKRILPFVTVEPIEKKQTPDFRKALRYGKSNLFLRTQFFLQEQKGFTNEPDSDKQYQGNRFKYYTKYQFNYKQNIKFGFVAEKDPGEAFFKGGQKQGFDYYSAHLQINNLGKFKTITVGDFQARFGQGLIAWSGLSTGKSSFVMTVKKKYDGLRKYSSTDENLFMRGIGTTIELGSFDATGFVSYKFIDANLSVPDTLTEEEIFAESLQTTGMHRNLTELEDKHAISEFIFGGNIKYKHPKFKVGASVIDYRFGADISKAPNDYNQYEFQGRHGMNASIDYQTQFKNISLFGEGAISLNGGYALLNSAVVKATDQLALAVLHRYYAKDYQALYAGGFAEQSKTTNENGVYFGAELYPIRKVKVSAYYDIYKFLWLKYQANAPTYGNEFFTKIDYAFNRRVNMHIQYKQEYGFQNSSDEFTGVVPLDEKFKRELRFHISYQLSKQLELKNRIAVSDFQREGSETETGFLFYQDVAYDFARFPLTMNLRLAFFDADYNARIYAYENDILYGYSIPGYSGEGIRTYFTFKYTVIEDFIDVWLRFANFSYSDRDVIGTGYDEIQGSNKSEIKFQIRIKF